MENKNVNEAKSKLAEAIGFISDETVDSTAEAMSQKAAPRRGSRKVLKAVLIAACVCLLICAAIGTAVYKKMIAPPDDTNVPKVLEGNSTEAPERERPEIAEAVPVYRSNGDGTCVVIGLENPENAMTLNVIIPEYSPNGDKVVDYAPENVLLSLPRVISGNDFLAILDKIAAVINADSAKQGLPELEYRNYLAVNKRIGLITDSGNSHWFLFTQFLAYFQETSMKYIETDVERKKLLSEYPMAADMDTADSFYVLADDNTFTEFGRLYSYLRVMVPSLTAQETRKYEEAADAAAWSEYHERVARGENPDEKLWEECKEAAALRYDGFKSFVDAAQVVSLSLPDSIEKLDPGILLGYSIKDFTVPAGVKEIHVEFFLLCPCLETVTVSGEEKWTVKNGTGSCAEYSSAEAAAILKAYPYHFLDKDKFGTSFSYFLLAEEEIEHRNNAVDDASRSTLQAFLEKFGERSSADGKYYLLDGYGGRRTFPSGMTVIGTSNLYFTR